MELTKPIVFLIAVTAALVAVLVIQGWQWFENRRESRVLNQIGGGKCK